MNKYLLGGSLAILFFLIQLFTLSDYGINWDSPYRMIQGQAYVQLFTTGKLNYDFQRQNSSILIKPREQASLYLVSASEYGATSISQGSLDTKEYQSILSSGKRISFYEDPQWNGTYFTQKEAVGHLAIVDILSALTNKLFFQQFLITSDLNGYRLLYIVIGSLGIFLTTLFAYEITGSFLASGISAALLGLQPVFFAESHFNMKDPMQAVFFLGVMWSWWSWIRYAKKKYILFLALFLTLALGVKWNVVFVPLIFIPWLLFIRKSKEFKKWFRPILAVQFSLVIVAALMLTILFWPLGWSNPLGKLVDVFFFYLDIGAKNGGVYPTLNFPFGISLYQLAQVVFQIQPITLVFVCIGIFAAWRQKGDVLQTPKLIFFWICVVLLRSSIFYSGYAAGLRQIMEILPALSLMGGIGVWYLLTVLKKIHGKTLRKILIFAGTILVCIFLSLPLIRLHPNENMYYNSLIGGLKGAYEKKLVHWTVSYGNVYKQAADWLNIHAEKDAKVAFLDGSMYALSPLFLRNDITISPSYFSGADRNGEYIVSLYDTAQDPYFPFDSLRRYLRPEKIISVEGIPVIAVYKNDSTHMKVALEEKEKTDVLMKSISRVNGDYFSIVLPSDTDITGITLLAPKTCDTQAQFVFIPTLPKKIGINLEANTFRPEKVKEDARGIHYFFPSLRARIIRIYPVSAASCFVEGKLQSISYTIAHPL